MPKKNIEQAEICNMNTIEFELKYKDKGGIKKLLFMIDGLETQRCIAKHFKVSGERVRQWMKEMFNIQYDPRPARRKLRKQKHDTK